MLGSINKLKSKEGNSEVGGETIELTQSEQQEEKDGLGKKNRVPVIGAQRERENRIENIF